MAKAVRIYSIESEIAEILLSQYQTRYIPNNGGGLQPNHAPAVTKIIVQAERTPPPTVGHISS